MNPATDVGKKDLPANIRSKFTEIDVPPPDKDRDTLLNIITHYIGNIAIGDKAAILDVAQFYAGVKELAEAGRIVDGCEHRPHYNMRTLSRALTFAKDVVQQFGLRRALWEGFTMAFFMVLNQDSEKLVSGLARRTLLSTVKNQAAFLSQSTSATRAAGTDVLPFGPFALPRGPLEEDPATDYILSPSVQKKLVDLARIIVTGRFPVLIQGPTSSGKTSAVHYLARRTGHRMVRINNHEHTDIQEYLGSYVTDPQTGKLVYRDGLLVQALRRGDWIVLDELNLAPTDVLEALNRLLDDNRELVIPETHEVIKPHPHFMLFATQNPPGAYGGRKALSRALRSRFLEVHFDDVPQDELEYILSQRSRIPPSYSQKIVSVFSELQRRRQVARIFEGKQGFATLRDLFRWAGRDAGSYQELAESGYMLLAERARREEDKVVVKEVLENVMNVKISESGLYDVQPLLRSGQIELGDSSIVWTKPMQRLFILVSNALKHNEPVLLVGETGTGKTSVCQVYADIVGKQLKTLNGHQNLEAADIIGGQRPIRRDHSTMQDALDEAAELLAEMVDEPLRDLERLRTVIKTLRESVTIDNAKLQRLLAIERKLNGFAGAPLGWQDGALLSCMREGHMFLLDEISLADDSVLERLNSVLEPSRTIVLAEKGGQDAEEHEVAAVDGFQFIATMNPGGDFGKKELSPALRNRFTEIWVPSITSRSDLEQIISKSWAHKDLTTLTKPILDFIEWIGKEIGDSSVFTIRDILVSGGID
jgi:midasin